MKGKGSEETMGVDGRARKHDDQCAFMRTK